MFRVNLEEAFSLCTPWSDSQSQITGGYAAPSHATSQPQARYLSLLLHALIYISPIHHLHLHLFRF